MLFWRIAREECCCVAIALAIENKLDPDYPDSIQFHVSKGRVSGSVLRAAVVVRRSCCGVREQWCNVGGARSVGDV